MAQQSCKKIAGLYIHIPFCRSKCSYCSFYSTTSTNGVDDFLKALCHEMTFYRTSFHLFDTLYFGGGTPSLLSIKQFNNLLIHAQKTLSFTKDPEITVEINPADMNLHDLQSLRCTGVNRISIGVQSFRDDVLTFLGRRHTGNQARHAIEDARRAGYDNISLDLMYGIPGQDMFSWEETLQEATSFAPEHLSCYELTVEDNTPLGGKCRMGEFLLPDEGRQLELFMVTSGMLENAGYLHYEVSNFSRNKTLRSQHNSKYWSHTPYLGLGPSAHSFAENRRWWNKGSLTEYVTDVSRGTFPVASSEILSTEAMRLEAFFLGFRTNEGIHLNNFNTRFSCNLLEEKADIIKKLQNSGFVKVKDGYLRPTRSGLAVADSLSVI